MFLVSSLFRFRFRRLMAAGIIGLWVSLVLFSCGRAPTFAESLRDAEPSGVVAMAQAHLDSIYVNHPENVKAEHRRICEMLSLRGLRDAALEMSCYPYGIDYKQRPDIAERLLTATLLPGKHAPEIEGIRFTDSKYTLLFFYESTCRSCQGMINFMKEHYGRFQCSGIRIVTISSDTDRTRFEAYSEKFPWPDKLCYYKKYDSPDFINYGVAATPTTFLVDHKGRVVEQYDSPQEVLDLLLK